MVGNPRLVITGLTGTGKTALALEAATKLNSVLISADARQVYKQMDIGTGKYGKYDNWQPDGQRYLLNGVPIYGTDLVDPDQSYNAHDFTKYAQDCYLTQPNSILVGGTGFYINALISPPDSLSIEPNQDLRTRMEQYRQQHTSEEYTMFLQQQLAQLNPQKLEAMNQSDRSNPRRLLRALEITIWQKNHGSYTQATVSTSVNYKVVILDAPKEHLAKKVAARVEQMFEIGLEAEVKKLVARYSWDTPGLSTMGYREWRDFIQGDISTEDLKNNIILHHLQYARRQRIYAKHITNAVWFDVSTADGFSSALDYCTEQE